MLNRPNSPGHQLAHPNSLACRKQLSLTSTETNHADPLKKPTTRAQRSDRRRTKKAQRKSPTLNPELCNSQTAPLPPDAKDSKILLPQSTSEPLDALLLPDCTPIGLQQNSPKKVVESSNSSVIQNLCLLPSRSKLHSLSGPDSLYRPEAFSKRTDALATRLLSNESSTVAVCDEQIRSAQMNSNVLHQGQSDQRVYLSSTKQPQFSFLRFASFERQQSELSSATSSQPAHQPQQQQQCLSTGRHLLAKRTRIEQSPSSDFGAEENLKRQKVDIHCTHSSTLQYQCSAAAEITSFETPSTATAEVIVNDSKEILLRMFESRLKVEKHLHLKEQTGANSRASLRLDQFEPHDALMD